MPEREKGKQKLEVYPPEKPLEYPFTKEQACTILGISSSTLIRWEKTGKVYFPRESKGGQAVRQIGPKELTQLLVIMKDQQYPKGPNIYQWLEDFDPTETTEITTPTGYRIQFEREEEEK
jgi:hypothetical protein